jgi:hypothetical protein
MPPDKIWVVVVVESGVSVLVGAYRDEEIALSRFQGLTKDTRPDYDDVGIFCVEIGAQPSDDRIA